MPDERLDIFIVASAAAFFFFVYRGVKIYNWKREARQFKGRAVGKIGKIETEEYYTRYAGGYRRTKEYIPVYQFEVEGRTYKGYSSLSEGAQSDTMYRLNAPVVIMYHELDPNVFIPEDNYKKMNKIIFHCAEGAIISLVLMLIILFLEVF